MDLIDAIRDGNIFEAERLILEDKNINFRSKFEETALITAIKLRLTPIVKLLIENGVDVNARDSVGLTPLMIATITHETETVISLINAGADVNAKIHDTPGNILDDSGKTALMFAADIGFLDIVKILTFNGAHIDIMDSHGETAISLANDEIAKFLKEELFKINELLSRNPLWFAISDNDLEGVRELMELDVNVNILGPGGNTPLMQALISEKLEIADVLINNIKTDLDLKNNNGEFPLLIAQYQENFNILRKLVEHGADINAELLGEKFILVVLRMLYERLYPSVEEIYKENYYKKQIRTINARTEKDKALIPKYIDFIKLLMVFDLDVNIKSDSDSTNPQLWISKQPLQNMELIKMFIKYDDDINFTDEIYTTYLYYAILRGNLEFVTLLVENGVDVNEAIMGFTPLYYAIQNGDDKIVEYLIENGADVHHYEDGGNTFLMTAAWVGNIAIVKMLIEAGININTQDDFGNTALSVAIKQGNKNVIKYLLDAGADVDQSVYSGKCLI